MLLFLVNVSRIAVATANDIKLERGSSFHTFMYTESKLQK